MLMFYDISYLKNFYYPSVSHALDSSPDKGILFFTLSTVSSRCLIYAPVLCF